MHRGTRARVGWIGMVRLQPTLSTHDGAVKCVARYGQTSKRILRGTSSKGSRGKRKAKASTQRLGDDATGARPPLLSRRGCNAILVLAVFGLFFRTGLRKVGVT